MAASTVIKGVYTIERNSTANGREFFQITGYTESGRRIRLREDTETEAKKLVETLQDEDKIFRAARDAGSKEITEKKRSLFTSDLITNQERVTDCENALRLFPKAPDGTPDPRWSVESAVRLAVELGYDPDLPHILVDDALDLYMPHLEWRSKLPKDREENIAKSTLGTRKYHRDLVSALFGGISLIKLASPGHLKTSLVGSSLSVGNQQKVASVVNGLMAWAMVDNSTQLGDKPAPAHRKYIAIYTPYFPPNGKGRKEVLLMNLTEAQLSLDAAWKHTMEYGGSRAAQEVMLTFCFLRPSEVDNPKFYVSENCKVAHVPDDSKTGWRKVKIPPNARIMLLALKAKGLLTFERVSEQTRARWRGQMGYHYSDSGMRGYVAKLLGKSYKNTSAAEARKIFRERHPFRPELGRWVKDKRRHTGTSYFLTACDDIGMTARQAGNSPKVVERHYSGQVDMKDVPTFYQMLATELYGAYDATKIAMPSWFKIQDSEEAQAEEMNVSEGVEAIARDVEKQDAEKVEARRQMLNRINAKSRATHKDKWNGTRRDKYATDEVRRHRISEAKKAGYALNKEKINAARRAAYANDPAHRERRLSENRKSTKQAVADPIPIAESSPVLTSQTVSPLPVALSEALAQPTPLSIPT